MLPVVREGARGPILFMLHWLGGGAQTWAEVSHGLAARGVRCIAVDLPGFGKATSDTRYDIASMATAVAETVQQVRADISPEDTAPWLIAGHSMGGTVAAVVARRAVEGTPGLENLRGLILVSASPPGPEPMPEEKRAKLLATLGQSTDNPPLAREHAALFVDENTGKLPLPAAVRERTIAGVLATDRAAFRHWLQHGSKEDWRQVIGKLPLPTLIFAGTQDEALGPDAQRQHTLPHFDPAHLVTLENTGHLAPLERPGELIEHLTPFIASLDLVLASAQRSPSPKFLALIGSKFVSPVTRDAMLDRLADAQDWNHAPKAFTPAEFRTLRALAGRVVPDAGFDLAGSLDHELACGHDDGWRFASLPPDTPAWQHGLRSLDIASENAHGVSFLALSPEQGDALLRHAASGDLSADSAAYATPATGQPVPPYNALQMQAWFQDVRSSFARLFVGDPRTLDRIGYKGFADDLGFTQIRLGEIEEFEP